MNMKLFMAIKKSGMKQYEVAEKAKMSESRLSIIINRRVKNLKVSEARNIALALCMTEEALFD